MDHDEVPSTPRGSFRKFLEQLSGVGKAIGVLTSGGDAQGARPPSPAGAEGDTGKKGWRNQWENVGTQGKRWGLREKLGVGEQPGAREPWGTFRGPSGRATSGVTAGTRKGGVW